MASRQDQTRPSSHRTDTSATTRFTVARVVSLTLAFGLAAILLFYSIRGIDWRQVISVARNANLPLLAAVLVLATGSLSLRAVRWWVLLTAERRVQIGTAFWATAAGYFGNSFLPARAGELVRTAIIASRSGLDGAYVLATALSERAADAIALVSFATIALLALPTRPEWATTAAKPFALIAIVSVLTIAFLPRLESAVGAIVGRLPLPQGLKDRLLSATAQALRGIRVFHDFRRLSIFLALTLVIWSIDAIGAIVGAAALGFSMSVPLAFLLLAALGLGSALPSTPGYVGIYQFVAVTVLTPFGFNRSEAIAYILVAQALNYIVIAFWGAGAFWWFRTTRRFPLSEQ